MGKPDYPTLREAIKVWARIGLLSFGGPAGQIAMMHKILVEERKWLGEKRFLHALNYCMLLPGPEAQQLAVYIGWLMHRTFGGIVAGVLFVLPGVIAIMAVSWIYAIWGNVGIVAALFFGLKAAVLAIVVQAVIRIGRRALKNRAMLMIATTAFIAIFAFEVPFPLIILVAGLIGFSGARANIPAFRDGGGHGKIGSVQVADADTLLGDESPDHTRVNRSWAFRISAILLGLWLVPVAVLFLVLGPANVFSQIAGFFSVMAVVTFGGAYAVLAYVAQEAVQNFGWLAPGDARRSWHGRNHTGPVDHGHAVRGVHGGFARSGHIVAAGRGDLGRVAYDLGYVYAVLPVDFPWSSLYRAAAGQSSTDSGPERNHRRCCWCGPEPCGVVRAACGLCRTDTGNGVWSGPDGSGSGIGEQCGGGTDRVGTVGGVPVSGRNHCGIGTLRRAWRGV